VAPPWQCAGLDLQSEIAVTIEIYVSSSALRRL
jgi:hypothetical protein